MLETYSLVPDMAISNKSSEVILRGGSLFRQAFLAAYPQAMEHLGVFPKRVHFGKTEDLQKQKGLDTPKAKLPVYQSLIRLGVPAEELDVYYDTVTNDWPYYTNYVEGEIYLPDRLLSGLQSTNDLGRLNSLKILGFHLGMETLVTLAHRVNPTEISEWSLFPRLQMQSTVDTLFKEVEPKMGKKLKDSKDRRRFRTSKEEIMQFFTEERVREGLAHYVACGAQMLMYHSPAESLMESEFELGRGFNEGTVNVLLEPIQRKYTALVHEDLGIEQGEDDTMTGKETFQKIKKRVSEVYSILGLLDIQDLFDAFIYSKIPRLFLESDDIRLNPFVYPQLAAA